MTDLTLLSIEEAAAGMARGRFDAVVRPTAPQTGFAFGTPVPANRADLTAPASFAGAPAVSLPLA